MMHHYDGIRADFPVIMPQDVKSLFRVNRQQELRQLAWPMAQPADTSSGANTSRSPAVTRSIVLVGLMGAGKSKIGRQISQDFDIPFIDSDQVIETVAGMDIPSIFELYGEDKFRAIEGREIMRLLTGAPAVLSTGGGAFIRQETRRLINQNALSVWLKAKPETLASRISNTDSRPLLKGKDPVAVLQKLAAEREQFYAEAELVVDTDGLSLTKAIEKVKTSITSYLMDDAI